MHSIDHIHSYWTDSSIPTFEQLQEELLCSINKNNPKYAIYKKLLSYIYQLQFKQSSNECYNDPSTKYYIIENPCPATGFFAGLRCWTAYFSESIFRNRTFLFHGKYNFAPNTYCENVTNNDTNNMECYFLPISSCNNITHLLFQQIHGKIDNTPILIYGEQKSIPKSITKLFPETELKYKHRFNFTGNKFLQDNQTHSNRILYFPSARWNEIKKLYDDIYDLTLDEFSSLLISYLLRQQPFIRKRTSLSILYSLNSIYTKWNLDNTISSMVRWSDKCYQVQNHSYRMRPEMDCFWIDEYLEIAQMFKKYLFPNITHSIITSESKIIINTAKKQQYHFNYEFIFNLNDVMQGGSELDFPWLDEHDAINIMISMLSTIKLQFGAKYYLKKSGSSWVMAIVNMARHLDCVPISSTDLLEIENDAESVGVFKEQFNAFYEYINSIENKRNERVYVLLNSDSFSDNARNGTHFVEWGCELTKFKNRKFSSDFDWKYNSTKKLFNLWNSSHCFARNI